MTLKLTQREYDAVMSGDYIIVPDKPQSITGMIEAAELSDEVKTALTTWAAARKSTVKFTTATVNALTALAQKNEKLYGTDAVVQTITESLAAGYKSIAWARLDKLPQLPQRQLKPTAEDMEHIQKVYERVSGKSAKDLYQQLRITAEAEAKEGRMRYTAE